MRFGVAEQLVNSRFGPMTLAQSTYRMASAGGADNSLMPRAVMTPKYLGTARVVPDIDAYLEPWTALGYPRPVATRFSSG